MPTCTTKYMEIQSIAIIYQKQISWFRLKGWTQSTCVYLWSLLDFMQCTCMADELILMAIWPSRARIYLVSTNSVKTACCSSVHFSHINGPPSRKRTFVRMNPQRRALISLQWNIQYVLYLYHRFLIGKYIDGTSLTIWES